MNSGEKSESISSLSFIYAFINEETNNSSVCSINIPSDLILLTICKMTRS